MQQCPKCNHPNSVYFDSEPGFKRNVCYVCGFSHCPKGNKQSMERQITGDTKNYGLGANLFERHLIRDEYEQEEQTAHYQIMKDYNVARQSVGVI